jgi:hypothetical protein
MNEDWVEFVAIFIHHSFLTSAIIQSLCFGQFLGQPHDCFNRGSHQPHHGVDGSRF